MSLKFIIATEGDLPEDETIKALYKKEGDKWVLGVEGAVPKAQLNEFRDQNIQLRKDLEGLGDVPPADAAKAIKRVEELEAQVDKDKGKFDQLLEKRTEAMKLEHSKQLEAIGKDLGQTRGQLKTLKIDQALIQAGSEFGLRAGAGPDLVSRGRSVFDLDEEGHIVAFDEDGKTKRYNAAGEPLQPKDWVAAATKEAAHLFDESQGAGSAGSGSAGTAGGKNPWAKDSWNLTEQGKLMTADPARAQRLAAQAGKKY